MPAQLANALSAAPILNAVETYRGSFIDLDRATLVDAAALNRGWSALTRKLRGSGLEHGDRVVMAVANGPQFPAALAALLANDASPLLVHWQTPPQELLRTALQFGARFVIADGERHDDLSAIGRSRELLSADAWLSLSWN
ncbi:MAG: hypothetical protein KF861_20010, partial [Planctomycetaceae bacterium]|nr:hypothetical protein [Planctomycetaceae bacterium]